MSLVKDLNDASGRLIELETQELYHRGVIETSFDTTGIADNAATSIFRIETTNETGSTDGGGYAVHIHALVGHALANNAANSAAKSLTAHFARVVKNDGSVGVTSAVTEISETASAATSGAARDIGTVTVTVVENSEYQVDVQVTVDLTGSAVTTAQVVCFVRVVWTGFLTAPVLTGL